MCSAAAMADYRTSEKEKSNQERVRGDDDEGKGSEKKLRGWI